MHRERDNGVAFVSGYDSPSTGSADEIFDPTEIDGTCATTQDQADVWMGDQVTGIVDDHGIAGATDPDCRNDIPDQLEIDIGNGNSRGRKVAGDGDPHIGLGPVLILNGTVPDLVGTRPDDRGIRGHVDASACPVQM